MFLENTDYKVPVRLYLFIIVVSMFLYLYIMLFQSNAIVPFCLVLTGLFVLISSYKKSKLLLSPTSIFSIVWLILIPICSFEYPVMRAMNIFEWQQVLLFIITFSVGSLFCFRKKEINAKAEVPFRKSTITFCYVVLIISIISLAMMFIQFKGIPLFASDANIAKDLFRETSIFSAISYFGYITILCLFMNDSTIIKNKLFCILSVIYTVMLLFSGERFFITLLILSLLFVYAKRIIDFSFLKKILTVSGVILLIFIFILNFRGNESQKEKYFIANGIYSGTAKELTATEFFRYMGMQQRLITQTYELIEPGQTKGTLTFSPFLKVVGIKSIALPKLQIYGYTSKSIITKTYSDFGIFWVVAVMFISFLIHSSYIKFQKDISLLSRYMTIVWLIFLLLSFYAYFDNYVILFFHFPVFIIFTRIFNRIKV